LLGLIATAASLALLLGPLRIIGAAVASVIGYAVVTAGLAVSLRRHDVTFRDAFLPGPADLSNIFRMASKSRLLCGRRDADPVVQGIT
jgi:hypothetical protein